MPVCAWWVSKGLRYTELAGVLDSAGSFLGLPWPTTVNGGADNNRGYCLTVWGPCSLRGLPGRVFPGRIHGEMHRWTDELTARRVDKLLRGRSGGGLSRRCQLIAPSQPRTQRAAPSEGTRPTDSSLGHLASVTQHTLFVS